MAQTAEDLATLSGVLEACFGESGDFAVIVEEFSNDTSCDLEVQTEAKRKKRKHSGDVRGCARDTEVTTQRTEFRVWSFLLAKWSPVFEKMVASDNEFTESQKAELVIRDFSAAAVEIFLRFLYSGRVAGPVTALAEVAAIADKYQVEALPPLCLRLVRKALTPEQACEVFALADRLRMAEMRADALDWIFAQHAEALIERPALRPQLLEEILSSGLLCIEADALKEIVRSWGTDEVDSLQSIINIRAHNVATEDVLETLWQRYQENGKQGVFAGCWVVMILAPEQGLAYTREQLEGMTIGHTTFNLRKGWVQWQFPHALVHLQGFCFGEGDEKLQIPASASFRIWSSEDGATWHLAYESRGEAIEAGAFLACKRPPSMVKCFKLEVLEGELENVFLEVHGILQTSV